MKRTIRRALLAAAVAACLVPAATPATADTAGTTDVTIVAQDGGGDGNLTQTVPISHHTHPAVLGGTLAQTGMGTLAAGMMFAAVSAASGAAWMLARPREPDDN